MKLGCREVLLSLVLVGQAAVLVHVQPWSLAYNHTVSVPRGWYAFREGGAPPQRGDYVRYDYVVPEWAYFRYDTVYPDGAKFMKLVGAVPGDFLRTEGPDVYRCPTAARTAACELLGRRQAQDPAGKPLPQVSYDGEAIPPGYYWLRSIEPHATSAYDSRYYGLVPRTRLKGHYYPLLTW